MPKEEDERRPSMKSNDEGEEEEGKGEEEKKVEEKKLEENKVRPLASVPAVARSRVLGF